MTVLTTLAIILIGAVIVCTVYLRHLVKVSVQAVLWEHDVDVARLDKLQKGVHEDTEDLLHTIRIMQKSHAETVQRLIRLELRIAEDGKPN
jgi:hypothetical protein